MGKKPANAAPENSPEDYLPYNVGGPYWTSESDGKSLVQFSKKGFCSVKRVPRTTIPKIFMEAAEKKGDKIVLRTENKLSWKRGDIIPEALPLKSWKSWTWKEFHRDVRYAAKAMISMGFEAHDSCNILGFNSPEWFIGMFAAMFAAGKAAGIYPSDNEESVQFKSHHSNGSVAFIENEEALAKFIAVMNELPYLKVIVTWACDAGKSKIVRKDGTVIKVMTFRKFLEVGSAQSDDLLKQRMDGINPSHCCSLVYTSGTTGKPKAVMISHDNVIYESISVNDGCIGLIGTKPEEERLMSYLPLSHVAGMLVDAIIPLTVGAWSKGWVSVNFARPYDIKAGSLVERLNAIKPTLFFGVPRVWEKVMEKLLARSAAQKDSALKKLIKSAKKRSLIYQTGQQLGGDGKTPKTMAAANVLLNVVKGKLGLDKVKFVFAGAAPMTPECLAFFGGLGINVNEAYGMSESTGAVTFSTDKYHTWGSVGYEIPGTEVKIFKINPKNGKKMECPPCQDLFSASEEEQGEICFRGRGVMMGYMANPKFGEEHMKEIEKKNSEAIDEDGWLHSGDKGAKDIRGMIKITGRYKELIIGAGGENVAPVPIEDELKKLCPFISNIMMVGNLRKFNVVLVTLKVKGATGELPGGDVLDGPAAALSSSKTIEDAMNDDVFINAITEAIQKTNSNKHVTPHNAAKVQKFTILPSDFSVVTGELTATFKLKRSVVDDKHIKMIDRMYESKDAYVRYEE